MCKRMWAYASILCFVKENKYAIPKNLIIRFKFKLKIRKLWIQFKSLIYDIYIFMRIHEKIRKR
jgi:hypothetical protein